jgi:hypothetical protein
VSGASSRNAEDDSRLAERRSGRSRPQTRVRGSGLATDTRGVSVALTHALTLGITAVLIIGLLFSAGQYLDTQEDRAALTQLDQVGNDMVAQIHALDQLNKTGEQVQATIEPNYPELVFDEAPYTIGLADADSTSRYKNAPNVDVVVTIDSRFTDGPRAYSVTTQTDLNVGSTVRGAQPVLRLCTDPQEITLGECP